MKKNRLSIPVIIVCVLLAACSSKQSASSVAQKWCDLNGKAHKAAEGPEKEKAEAALEKWEKETEAKYDKAFMEEVGKEVEKCEDASEGRK